MVMVSRKGALPPLFPGFLNLVRAYKGVFFYQNQNNQTDGFSLNQLSGSGILVANVELRLPLTVPERLSVFKQNFLPTELA